VSTYSNLKIELMVTGENSATWGNVTNVNLGTALEEAAAGSANVAFSNASVTLTLTDTNATQTARNMRLNLTGTATAGYNLVLGSGCQINKPYIINNGTDGTITVKNTTGSGIAVPAGKTTWVYNNGTNVVDVVTHLTSLYTGSLEVGGNILLSASTPTITFNTGGAYVSNANTANTLAISTSGTERFRIGSSGQWGLSGTNYGTSGQVLTSQGSGSAPVWASAATAGTVTSVSGTGSANGLSLSGTVTSSGNITLGGSVTSVATGATIDGVVIGYRNIPRSTTSGTATTSDVGKVIAVTAGITIPNSTFAAGDAISIYNNSSSSITITQGSSLTMYQVGTATTGNRTLAQRGMATIWFNSATDCVISGGGLS